MEAFRGEFAGAGENPDLLTGPVRLPVRCCKRSVPLGRARPPSLTLSSKGKEPSGRL
jgi:hypothetical protein